MHLKILFHDRCFDGLASAALFAAFARSKIPHDRLSFGGLQHGPEGGLDESRLSGDQNVVLDFAYLSSEKLSWWIDHHRSAFASEEDEGHMRARAGAGAQVTTFAYDPSAPSCTGLLARFLSDLHGFDVRPYAELTRWAEIIDSASFATPSAAVELAGPAFELMLWIERSLDFTQRCKVIEAMSSEGIAAARALPEVAGVMPALLAAHQEEANFIAERCVLETKVVYCDLSETALAGVNKFVPYHLFPDAPYAVMFSRSSTNVKVSVGYNAWHPPEARMHDIAALCKAQGGGGHPYVGAITRELGEEETLREVSRSLVAELNR